MREPLFRKKTAEEGTGWTFNNRASWLITGVAVAVLIIVLVIIDAAIEDQVITLIVTVAAVMLWAVTFVLFAKRESERL